MIHLDFTLFFAYPSILPDNVSPAVARSTLFNNSAGAFCTVGWVTLACRRGGCCANRCLHQLCVNTGSCLGTILHWGDLHPPPLFPILKNSVVALSLLHSPASSLLITPPFHPVKMSSMSFCHAV